MSLKSIELLAPGGNLDSIKAAILAGANAIYCGLDRFNARNKSEKISFDDLLGILNLAHKNNCEVFLTLNIIILENELPALFSLLNKLQYTSIDGLIIQDLGLFYIVSKYYKEFSIHASTQATTHNIGQVDFLKQLSVSRINLSRELSLSEIKEITDYASKLEIQTEVFVHGSYCISFSGLCYISSLQSGNSGNRGRCNQSCRDKYTSTNNKNSYPLNLKDNSAFTMLQELAEAGVYSLKIEGRIKKYDYVYTVVDLWRKQIDKFYNKEELSQDKSEFYKVFNRDFSDGFLRGRIDKQMYIDNPRDHSIQYLSDQNNYANADEKEQAELQFYKEKDKQKLSIREQISCLDITKEKITISLSGKESSKLEVSVNTEKIAFKLFSKSNLTISEYDKLDYNSIYKKFKTINDTEYIIEEINLDKLEQNLSVPFKELNVLKKEILLQLKGEKKSLYPVDIPKLTKLKPNSIKTKLSVLISDKKDLYLCKKSNAQFYFALPSNFKKEYDYYFKIFANNKNLIPWFPSILIGEEFENASHFLTELKPRKIVSNNIGLGYLAYKEGIDWIAGPQLNITNSFSLLALKEKFNCSGAFISNEINKAQIQNINSPSDFDLHYSIYHPIATMTSRQCFFQQVTGCKKHILDNTCIAECKKSATITNQKEETYYIDKSKGNYNALYNESNFLNTDIIAKIPNTFSNFLIDLRDIKTQTQLSMSKLEAIELFQTAIESDTGSIKQLQQSILPSNNSQYLRGLS